MRLNECRAQQDAARWYDSSLEPTDTVFYLLAGNAAARRVISGSRNSHIYMHQSPYGESALRIRVGCSPAPYLVRMGNRSIDDIVLGGKKQVEMCHFFFNSESGELVLRDVSTAHSTKLVAIDSSDGRLSEATLMVSGEEQCAVVLSPHPRTYAPRMYELHVGKEVFYIHPPLNNPPPNKRALALIDKRDYCHDIETAWDVKEVNCEEIYSISLRQDTSVHKVAIRNTGLHVACKVYGWELCGGKSYKQWRERTAKQLELIQEACKQNPAYIVPWYRYEFNKGGRIQIFMPLYRCSLADLIDNGCFREHRRAIALTAHMAHNISTALAILASLPEPMVHRDVKPHNILFANGAFYLADFGIAKVVDNSHTDVGSNRFKAPEIQKHTDHTTAVDIFSLGLTIAACLWRKTLYDVFHLSNDQWITNARNILVAAEMGSSIAQMLQEDPRHRPTAIDVCYEATAILQDIGCQYEHDPISLCPYIPLEHEAARADECATDNDTAPGPQSLPAPNFDSATGPATFPTPAGSPEGKTPNREAVYDDGGQDDIDLMAIDEPVLERPPLLASRDNEEANDTYQPLTPGRTPSRRTASRASASSLASSAARRSSSRLSRHKRKPSYRY